MNVEELYFKIALPAEIKSEVLSYANKKIPEGLLSDLTDSRTAKTAYQRLKEICPAEHKGLDILSYMLSAALNTHKRYLEAGIDEEIYLATMECFSRFVAEHKASYGDYGFDRGWWAYRHLSMILFKVGELEYELGDDEKTIYLHIPTGANIELSCFRDSLDCFRKFVKEHWPEKEEYPCMLDSWLLSPALAQLLKPDCNIIRFQNCFSLMEWKKEDNEFLQWVYGRTDIEYENLPENTSLQRNMKKYLMQGGRIGSGQGILSQKKKASLSFDEDRKNAGQLKFDVANVRSDVVR